MVNFLPNFQFFANFLRKDGTENEAEDFINN